jgi:hypothetical protein
MEDDSDGDSSGRDSPGAMSRMTSVRTRNAGSDSEDSYDEVWARGRKARVPITPRHGAVPVAARANGAPCHASSWLVTMHMSLERLAFVPDPQDDGKGGRPMGAHSPMSRASSRVSRFSKTSHFSRATSRVSRTSRRSEHGRSAIFIAAQKVGTHWRACYCSLHRAGSGDGPLLPCGRTVLRRRPRPEAQLLVWLAG